MTTFPRIALAVSGVLSLSVGGCGPKLNVSRPFKLPDGATVVYLVELDPQSRDQTITVEVLVDRSDDDPVDVFVLRNADVPDPILHSEAEKKEFERKALGFIRAAHSGTTTFPVPANTAYKVVVVQSGKKGTKSEGTVKVKN